MVHNIGYYLLYDESSFTLILHIHEKIISLLEQVVDGNILREFGFPKEIIDGYVSLDFLIPEAQFTDKACPECKGSGRMNFPNEDRFCYFCNGQKRAIEYGKDERKRICTLLENIFSFLEKAARLVYEDFQPHVLFVTRTESCPGGYAIGGGISELMHQASLRLYATELEKRGGGPSDQKSPVFVFGEAQRAMTSAWCRMNLTLDPIKIAFENRPLLKSSGHFYIECSGENGCALYSSNDLAYFFDEGKALCSHNVDNTMQQLTLLIGFAKMYEKIIEHLA